MTTNYQYVSGKLMYEDRNGTDVYYFYDSNGTPTSIKYYEPDGTTYTFYLATNQQGDVIGIYNSSGNIAVKYEYDAWGNIIAETNATGGTPTSLAQKWSDINPFRYRGYYYDSETGLYYLNSRYYDSETGRFINADDASVINATPNALVDKNLFAYCDNNPVVRKDEQGDYWELIALGAAVGGLVNAGLSAYYCYKDYGYVDAKVVITNFISGAIVGALSMTNMSRMALTAVNAVSAGVTYMSEKAIMNEPIKGDELLVSVAFGAAGGYLGGDGLDAKTLSNNWNVATKAIGQEVNRANRKYALKEIARHTARRQSVRTTVRTALGGSAAIEISIAFAKRKFGY